MAKGIKLNPQAKFGGLYKVCPKCGEDKPLEMFTRDLSKSDGVTSHCKQCRNNYRKTPHASALHKEQARKYYHRNISPEKKECMIILHKLLRYGLKKTPCEICGTTENIQAHHPDYTNPFDIVWLCKRCHSYIHREEKKANAI